MKQQNLNPRRVTELLNQSAYRMNDDTLEALRHRRQRALSCHQQAHKPVLQLIAEQGFYNYIAQHSTQLLAAMAVLLALMLAALSTQDWSTHSEYDKSRLDIAILTDDIPLEAFIDS